jgi:hypothetical protein
VGAVAPPPDQPSPSVAAIEGADIACACANGTKHAGGVPAHRLDEALFLLTNRERARWGKRIQLIPSRTIEFGPPVTISGTDKAAGERRWMCVESSTNRRAPFAHVGEDMEVGAEAPRECSTRVTVIIHSRCGPIAGVATSTVDHGLNGTSPSPVQTRHRRDQ